VLPYLEVMSSKAFLLMVDDDEDDKSLFEEILKEIDPAIGFDSAENGQIALAKLREPEVLLPDLMIVDLNMPQLDGKELLNQLKRDDDLKKIPVIIFTTSIRRQDIERTLGMGAVCFATKPATVRDLRSFISAIGSNLPGDPQNMMRMLSRLSFVTPNAELWPF
jgi:CheY-like chemotaxis protein